MPRIYLALVHFPVIDKNGETVASAVTNLDLHDISRAARTYGARALFVVTPVAEQAALVERIVAHWTTGRGGRYNPKRREAVEGVRVSETLGAAVDEIEAESGERPRVVATCARDRRNPIGFAELKRAVVGGAPHLLVFGTAWGLADAVLDAADRVLEPIRGQTDYNHLSVRSAAAIVLDRLLGERE